MQVLIFHFIIFFFFFLKLTETSTPSKIFHVSYHPLSHRPSICWQNSTFPTFFFSFSFFQMTEAKVYVMYCRHGFHRIWNFCLPMASLHWQIQPLGHACGHTQRCWQGAQLKSQSSILTLRAELCGPQKWWHLHLFWPSAVVIVWAFSGLQNVVRLKWWETEKGSEKFTANWCWEVRLNDWTVLKL